MRERIAKFIIMVVAVIVIGTGITMLNWNIKNTSKNPGITLAAILEDKPQAEEAAQDGGFDMALPQAPAGGSGPQVQEEAAGIAPLEDAGEELKVRQADDLCQGGAVTEAAVAGAAATEAEEYFLTITEDGPETEEKEGISVTYGTEGTEDAVWEELVIVEVYSSREEAAQAYYLRLNEMDRKLSEKYAEAAKKPVADQKSVADEALKFWDDELNAVYQALREELEEEAFYALREEERAWLRTRDEAAAQAAAAENFSNSSQNLAYTLSLTASTKDRVYELAEMYYGEESK